VIGAYRGQATAQAAEERGSAGEVRQMAAEWYGLLAALVLVAAIDSEASGMARERRFGLCYLGKPTCDISKKNNGLRIRVTKLGGTEKNL
jgi:hypothetical protein